MIGRIAAVAAGLAFVLPASVRAAGEPDEPGPFEVQTDSYDFGDEAFGPAGFGAPTELRAVVYSPVALDQGPFPLVVVLHGRHATCYDPASPAGTPNDGSFFGAFGEWPCTNGRVAIPSHEGYAGASEILASHGYIVVSISANGINAADDNVQDGGADARAQLIVAHLNQWAGFNTTDTGPFGAKYIGAVDVERIGLVGHSRGGEGVASAVLLDQELGLPIGIDAALLLAPVDFNRGVLANVALGVVLPYCDGDVFDLQGAHYFDDARYAQPGDLSPKYIFAIHGANHNYFNTVWSPSTFVAGAVDDFSGLAEALGTSDPDCSEGPGSDRLTEVEQQAILGATMSAFFRRHLGDEEDFDELLRGDTVAAAAVGPVFTTYLGPDDPTMRLDVNRLDDDAALTVNALGESVTAEALAPYAVCGVTNADATIEHCVDTPGMFGPDPFDGREPHTPGLGQLRIAFETGAQWTNALPAATDVSGLSFLQFRVAVDFEGPPRVANGVAFSVVLTDGAGQSASLPAQAYTAALGPTPGTLTPILPRKLLHGVRIPLADFQGIDPTDLASIAFHFDDGPGALLLSDLGFTDAAPQDEPTGTGTDGGTTGAPGLDESSGPDDPDEGTGGSTAGPGTGGSDTGSPGAEALGDDGGCACRHRPGRGPGSLWTALLGLGVLGSRRRHH